MYKKKHKLLKSGLMYLYIILQCCNFSNNALAQSMLDRNTVISKSIEKSYTLQNQKIEVAKDKLDKKKVFQTYLPNLSFNSTYTRLNDDIMFKIPPIDLPAIDLKIPSIQPIKLDPITMDPLVLQKKNIFKMDATASMVLFTGFKAPYTYKAIKHKQDADEQMVNKETIDIIKEVIEYYDKMAVVDQSLKVLKESEQRLEEETRFVLKAINVGLATPYDRSKIELAQQDIIAKKIELYTNRKLIISKLNQLSGIGKSDFEMLHPTLEVWVTNASIGTVEDRPEVKALKEAEIALNYKKKTTMTSYVPVVYAFGKRELRENDLSVLDPKWYVGVGLKWNVFDGLQNYRDVQKNKLEEITAHNNIENAISMYNVGYDKVQYELELATQLVSVAVKKKGSASKGLEIAISQYEQGLGSITERVAAETDMQMAQMDYIQAIYKQRMATLNLLEATGKLTLENIK